MNPDDVRGPEEEEGPAGEEGRGDDVGLDRRLSALVTQNTPDRGGDRVRAVFQPEEEADVERTQLKVSKDLKREGRQLECPEGQC